MGKHACNKKYIVFLILLICYSIHFVISYVNSFYFYFFFYLSIYLVILSNEVHIKCSSVFHLCSHSGMPRVQPAVWAGGPRPALQHRQSKGTHTHHMTNLGEVKAVRLSHQREQMAHNQTGESGTDSETRRWKGDAGWLKTGGTDNEKGKARRDKLGIERRRLGLIKEDSGDVGIHQAHSSFQK